MPVTLNLLQQSTNCGGTVTDPAQGVVTLFHQVGDSNVLRTMNVSKMKAGTVVELTIRLVKSTRRQVVGVREISLQRMYDVRVTAVESGVVVSSFVDWIKTNLSNRGMTMTREQVTSLETSLAGLSSGTGDSVQLVANSPYKIAEDICWMLNQEADGRAYFTVNEAQAVDGAGVTGFSIDDLDYVNGHYIPEEMRPVFVASAYVSKLGQRFNILLTGASGYGKTSTFEALAKWLGYDFLRVNCASITDVKSWFGNHEAKGGSTFFVPTKFTEMIRRGKCVVVLDEVNRVEAWLTNPLFEILDHARRTIVHDEEIEVGEGVIFGLTMNVGAKYAGTFVTDAAFLNRIDATVELKAPSVEREVEILMQHMLPSESRRNTKLVPEEVANSPTYDPSIESMRIVTLLNKLRDLVDRDQYDVDVSTRTGLKLVNLMRLGVGLAEACNYVIVNTAQPAERKAIVDIINLQLER